MAVGIGLELGPSSARAVKLERKGLRLRLVASAQVSYSGAIGEELIRAVRQLRKTLSIRQPVVLGIPSRLAIVATVEPLVVNWKRTSPAIQFELQQRLPYDVSQTVWHSEWFPTNGQALSKSARRSESQRPSTKPAVVAAIKRAILEEYLSLCRKAGLAIQALEVAGLAAANFWLRQRDGAPRPDGILLNIDPGALEWIIITSSGVHVVPILLPASESIERQAQDPQPLISGLKASWLDLHDQLAIKDSPRILLLGGLADEPGLKQELMQGLGCEIACLDPSEALLPGPTKLPNPQRFVVACGLALQGLGLARLPLDLKVTIQRDRRMKQVRVGAQLIGLMSVLLAVAFGASGMAQVLKARQNTLGKLTLQLETYQRIRPEARLELQRQSQLERRLKQLEGLMQSHALLVWAFGQISEALPDQVWLIRLDMSKNASLDAVLEGRSRSFQGVTRLIEQLKSSLTGASVKPLATSVSPDPVTGKELVAFTIQAKQTIPALSDLALPQQEAIQQSGSQRAEPAFSQ